MIHIRSPDKFLVLPKYHFILIHAILLSGLSLEDYNKDAAK